jgi:hypothetical protein
MDGSGASLSLPKSFSAMLPVNTAAKLNSTLRLKEPKRYHERGNADECCRQSANFGELVSCHYQISEPRLLFGSSLIEHEILIQTGNGDF